MTIICGIQLTGVVTMATEVLHNTCNMCFCDLPDMNALIPWACGPQASGIHIRQIPMPMLQLLLVPSLKLYNSIHIMTILKDCYGLIVHYECHYGVRYLWLQ